MTAVLTRARAELRARRASMIALTLLVGIGAATVMTLAAGARRTDTAYPRFARAYKAADVVVYPSFGSEFAILDFNTWRLRRRLLDERGGPPTVGAVGAGGRRIVAGVAPAGRP